MENLSPQQASLIRDFFLVSIESQHQAARLMIQGTPAEHLEFKPEFATKTVSQLAWSLFQAENYFLTGICDGHMPSMPEKSGEMTVKALMAWDDAHFPAAYRRLTLLSGEELLRPLTFQEKPRLAINVLATYREILNQLHGQLMSRLVLSAAAVPVAESSNIELTDAELAGVTGGTNSSPVIIINPTNPTNTVTFTTTAPTTPQILNTNSGTLGSLFTSGGNSAPGFAALFNGIGLGFAVGPVLDALLCGFPFL